MATETRKYTRLPGHGRSFAVMGGISTLWMAADHLLQIQNNRYSEDYRRFYFADIQAITLRRTRHREITCSIVGTLLLLTIALHIIAITRDSSDPTAVWAIAGFFETVFAIPLIFSFLRGPTCVCHIQTAVQREKLGSLTKHRTALKAIEQIRSAVTAVQGEPNPELLIPPAATHRVAAPVRVATPNQTSSVVPNYIGSLKAVSLLLGIFSFIAGVMVILRDASSGWDYALQGILATAQIALSIFVVNRASDKATWTKIGLVGGCWIFFFALLISMISQGDIKSDEGKTIADHFFGWGSAGLFGVVAIVEMFGLFLYRDNAINSTRNRSTPPPVPLAAFKDLE